MKKKAKEEGTFTMPIVQNFGLRWLEVQNFRLDKF